MKIVEYWFELEVLDEDNSNRFDDYDVLEYDDELDVSVSDGLDGFAVSDTQCSLNFVAVDTLVGYMLNLSVGVGKTKAVGTVAENYLLVCKSMMMVRLDYWEMLMMMMKRRPC